MRRLYFIFMFFVLCLVLILLISSASVAAPFDKASLAYQDGGRHYDMVVHEGHLFRGEGPALEVYRIDGATSLTLVRRLLLPGSSIRDIATSGSLAYVANFHNGLVILDISEPANPIQVGGVAPEPQGAWFKISLLGDRAYLTEIAAGPDRRAIVIVDISIPTAPNVLGRHDADLAWWTLPVDDEYLYFGSETGPVAILNVADPASPVKVGTIGSSGSNGEATKQGNLAFLACHGSWQMLDVSNPAQPTRLWRRSGTMAWDMEWRDDLIYLSSPDFQILDVSYPDDVKVVSSTSTNRLFYGIVVSGDHIAYLGDWIRGIEVRDVSDPATPELIGEVPYSIPSDMVLTNGRMLLATGSELEIYSLTNPSTPVLMGKRSFEKPLVDLTLSGPMLFVSMQEDAATISIEAFDLTEFDDWKLLGELTGGLRPAYWGSLEHRLVLTRDVSTSQHRMFHFPQTGEPAEVLAFSSIGASASSSGHLVLTLQEERVQPYDSTGELLLWDISVPTSPTLASTIPWSPGTSFAMLGSHAYLINADEVTAYDLSDVAHPSVSGTFQLEGESLTMLAARDGALYLTSGNGTFEERQLLVLDTSDPGVPVLAARIPLSISTADYGFQLDGNVLGSLNDRTGHTLWKLARVSQLHGYAVY